MRWIKRLLFWALVVLMLIQFMPYGRDHTNPPVTSEPAWPSPRVRELARRACFDCHSNESRWPWYSHVAPMSWLVQRDVDEGREELNFSQWDRAKRGGEDAAEELAEGEMPPWFYLPLHAEARLTDAEKAELVTGLKALPAAPGRQDGAGSDRDDEGR